MKLIFLDIDGVLNGHDRHRHPNGYCGIDPQCVYRLNRIVAETKARIVISSAWRYLVGEQMTLGGFRSMLMTYGLDKSVCIYGRTCRDEEVPDRGDQIKLFLEHPQIVGGITSYVILDDGSTEPPHPPATKPLTDSLVECHGRGKIVFTDGTRGLRDVDAWLAIGILNQP